MLPGIISSGGSFYPEQQSDNNLNFVGGKTREWRQIPLTPSTPNIAQIKMRISCKLGVIKLLFWKKHFHPDAMYVPAWEI